MTDFTPVTYLKQRRTIKYKGIALLERLKESALYSRLIKNISISISGAAILMLLSFARVPLLTKNLAISDYGKMIIVTNFFAMISLVFNLRVNDLIFRFLPQFEKEENQDKIRALLQLSVFLCAVLSVIIILITIGGGKWAAVNLYKDESLYRLLQLYLLAGMLSPFNEFSNAILRIKNRFSAIVIPQVAGGITSLILIIICVVGFGIIDLFYFLGALVVGVMISRAIPLAMSLYIVKKHIFTLKINGFHALLQNRRTIISTLLHTNLITYLKLSADNGGLFLLSILAPPEQVALFGIAKRLTQPLLQLQNNIQSALNPEVVKLYGQKQYKKLYLLIQRIVKANILVGGIILVLAFVLAKPVILLFSTEKYLAGLPVFYIYISTIYLTFISLPFFYLSLSMDKLKRRNLIVSFRLVYLIIFAFTGFNAVKLALVQLLGALTVRLFNDIPISKTLRKKSRDRSSS